MYLYVCIPPKIEALRIRHFFPAKHNGPEAQTCCLTKHTQLPGPCVKHTHTQREPQHKLRENAPGPLFPANKQW